MFEGPSCSPPQLPFCLSCPLPPSSIAGYAGFTFSFPRPAALLGMQGLPFSFPAQQHCSVCWVYLSISHNPPGSWFSRSSCAVFRWRYLPPHLCPLHETLAITLCPQPDRDSFVFHWVLPVLALQSSSIAEVNQSSWTLWYLWPPPWNQVQGTASSLTRQ